MSKDEPNRSAMPEEPEMEIQDKVDTKADGHVAEEVPYLVLEDFFSNGILHLRGRVVRMKPMKNPPSHLRRISESDANEREAAKSRMVFMDDMFAKAAEQKRKESYRRIQNGLLM